ncbi:putative LRR receptor-like serine/threonine-protein kinase [Tripterygium wilfordii]|uniref:non-specific serine/threonine protein kinase n=2 Tax=Tripterygium wilfordii TaxID=458696 RepID=A0A7J7CTT6_TRIWF|nr:putative LRR receptor-like serine/threonine-protein kinase [Tripterygium wilfordii]
MNCLPQSCPISDNFEYVPASPVDCFCAAPFGIGLRLRSPSISHFPPYIDDFMKYITSNLQLFPYQLAIDSYSWENGPRLRMFLKIFPPYSNTSHLFNDSEIQRISTYMATFLLPRNDTFGPYDLLNFTFLGPYEKFDLEPLKSAGLSKGALIGIVIGSFSGGVAIFLVIAVLFRKSHARHQNKTSRKQKFSKIPFRTGNIKEFDFKELELATGNFSITTQIGQGGYGKVYRGTVADGTVVAIKRAQQLSLHGQKEFFTEIEFLSRLHHRNLVSLVGYCHEEDEQMLVYEFMPNGSLHDILSGRFKKTLNFAMRLHIAMGSAKGILYLHTEADPPIIHRDIKATNILLDLKFNAKVSDFGISRLSPVQDTLGASAQISTAVKGTPGYVDPEYFLSHKLTQKSDVYSLGVVFLELLTGMKPISHGRNLVREVCTACQSGMMFSIIDGNMGPYPSECVKKFMALALKCCEDETDARPSMLEAVRELENISSMLPESDTIPSDSDTTTSGTADLAPLSIHSRGSSAYGTNDFLGSNLVSGVIPTIRPR